MNAIVAGCKVESTTHDADIVITMDGVVGRLNGVISVVNNDGVGRFNAFSARGEIKTAAFDHDETFALVGLIGRFDGVGSGINGKIPSDDVDRIFTTNAVVGSDDTISATAKLEVVFRYDAILIIGGEV